MTRKSDEVIRTAQALIDAINANLDRKKAPLKWVVPWGPATDLVNALTAYYGGNDA